MLCVLRFNDGSQRKILNVVLASHHDEAIEGKNIFVYTRNKKTGITKEIGFKGTDIKSFSVREAW
jgi:hypothetical protein